MKIDVNAADMPSSRSARAARSGSGVAFSINVAKLAAGTSDLDDALAAFRAEAHKTPRERCRDQVMKDWGITQDYIDRLPAKEAQALNERIEQEVSRRMQAADPLSGRQPGDHDDQSDGASVPPAPEGTITTMQVLDARGATRTGAAPHGGA